MFREKKILLDLEPTEKYEILSIIYENKIYYAFKLPFFIQKTKLSPQFRESKYS